MRDDGHIREFATAAEADAAGYTTRLTKGEARRLGQIAQEKRNVALAEMRGHSLNRKGRRAAEADERRSVRKPRSA